MSDFMDKLNRLCKWRILFTGWQTGTRPKGDPEADAIRDHREHSLVLRAEVSALVGLLLEKKVITYEEWTNQLGKEADELNLMLENRFPGIRAKDFGLEIYDLVKAGETMKGWKP